MGIVRYLRDVPPARYLLKIESFSLLLKTGVKKYESTLFEACGYKWRLSLYPNGNTKGEGAGHISLYLGIDVESLKTDVGVNVFLKMFVFDKKHNKYLTIEDDDKERNMWRFDKMKSEWGFDQLISQVTLNDPSNGFLVNDECVFGVEVFVDKYTGKGESLSIITVDTRYNSYQWLIPNFSGLDDTRLWSPEFTIAQRKWKLSIDPKGYGTGKGQQDLTIRNGIS